MVCRFIFKIVEYLIIFNNFVVKQISTTVKKLRTILVPTHPHVK